MGTRLLFIVIVTVLLSGVAPSQAGTETRTARLVVRVNVIRSCSVETRSSAMEGAVLVTCSRGGSEPGVVSTVSGAGLASRVVPVPARQTTVVATPAPMRVATSNGPAAAAAPTTRQVVVLNF